MTPKQHQDIILRAEGEGEGEGKGGNVNISALYKALVEAISNIYATRTYEL